MSSSSVAGSILGIVAPLVGCTNLVAGVAGSVPSPPAGSQQKALLGDGTWGTVGGGQITKDITQTAHGFVVGNWIRLSAASTYAKAQANNSASAELVGVVTEVTDANTFTVTVSGYVDTLTGLAANSIYFLSDLTAGAMTLTEPTAVSSISKPVFYSDTTTSGYLLPYRGSPAQGQTAVVQHGSQLITAQTLSLTSSNVLPLAGSQITLPAAGTYKIAYNVCGTFSTSTSQVNVALYDTGANTRVAGTTSGLQTITGNTGGLSHQGQCEVTVTSSTSYELRADCNATMSFVVRQSEVQNAVPSGASVISYVQIGAAPVPMDLVGEYVAPVYASTTTVTTTGTSAATALDYLSITIPTAGTWEVRWAVRGSNAATSNGLSSALFDNSNVLQANSEAMSVFFGAATTSQTTSNGNYIVTTTGSTTYKVRIWGINAAGPTALSDVNGRSFVMARKISGFIPSSGQTVDYSAAYLGTSQAGVVANDHIKFDSVTSGNIPLDTATTYSTALNVASIGRFTLTAGKTYRLEASAPQITTTVAAADAQIAWYNADSGVQLGTAGIVYGQANNTIQTSNYVSTVFTPSSNTRVEVRVLTISSGSFTVLGGVGAGTRPAWASITQLGSSSAITNPNPLPVTQTFLASGTYTPTSGMKYVEVKIVGGGGSNGAAPSTSTGNASTGGAGGGAGYAHARLTAAQVGASQAVTIGAGGTAVTTAQPGNAGANSTFGGLLTAGGGTGGSVGSNNVNLDSSSGGSGGSFTVTTGTDIGSFAGEPGGPSFGVMSANYSSSVGKGGDSGLGRGAAASAGINAVPNGNSASANTGGGASGSFKANGNAGQTGGAGGSGKCIVTEYFQ